MIARNQGDGVVKIRRRTNPPTGAQTTKRVGAGQIVAVETPGDGANALISLSVVDTKLPSTRQAEDRPSFRGGCARKERFKPTSSARG